MDKKQQKKIFSETPPKDHKAQVYLKVNALLESHRGEQIKKPWTPGAFRLWGGLTLVTAIMAYLLVRLELFNTGPESPLLPLESDLGLLATADVEMMEDLEMIEDLEFYEYLDEIEESEI